MMREVLVLVCGVSLASGAAALPTKSILVDPASGKTIVSGPLVDSPRTAPAAPDIFPIQVFSNPAPITINDAAAATPYPSDINVTGVTYLPSRIQLTLNGFSHTFPSDVDMIVVGPTGAVSYVMSDQGGSGAVTNLTITFDANAPGPLVAPLSSGIFQPTADGTPDTFTPPAPAGPYTADFNVFGGVDPNGTWSLYVMDNAALDVGSISGGWTLTLLGPLEQSVTLVSESCAPANGALDPGETVTASVCVENSGASATGIIAGTLLATGGVENPSGTADFGAIGAGATVCRDFTFNVDLGATCGSAIDLSVDYTEDGSPVGTETTALATGALGAPAVFSNVTPVVIPGAGTSGPAVPYPSTINVAGVVGTVGKVTVTITNFNHTFPDDVDVLLVGPTGATLLLMSDAGGSTDAVNLTYTFDQAAVASLTDGGANPSGTYRPSNYGTGDTFPAPAPVGPYGASLEVFNGLDPNGTWSLFVFDDVGGDVGNFNGGWSLSIQTLSCCTGACSLTTPANQAVSNDPGLCTAVATYSPPVVGGICGEVLCVPASGSTFPVGPTTVTCTAEAGTSGAFTVTVNDTEPPQITCPADIEETLQPGQSGLAVSYADPAPLDNCPAASTACTPPSGSVFPSGTTPVSCMTTDASGNTATCSFDVILRELSVVEIPAATGRGLTALALLLAGAALLVLRRQG